MAGGPTRTGRVRIGAAAEAHVARRGCPPSSTSALSGSTSRSTGSGPNSPGLAFVDGPPATSRTPRRPGGAITAHHFYALTNMH
jgi:hypothetical protein